MSIEVSAEAARALAAGLPVVALESTLICHGFPRPDNVALAFEMTVAVRAAGAVPAIIAVVDGRVRAGLDGDELRALAEAPDVAKCSTRDLALVAAQGRSGATTVAATVFIAAQLGIEVMATGGLGGVHQGGELSLDVSADLEELARRRMAVVCSGAKSILDLGRTLERLESLGIGIVGCGCAELPGFHTAHTGLAIPRVDELAELVAVFETGRSLGVPSSLVVAQPPPAASALSKAEVERLVAAARAQAAAARAQAAAAGVHGPAETPYLLRAMAELSRGATVRVNRELVLCNARLAARLAVALAERRAQARPV